MTAPLCDTQKACAGSLPHTDVTPGSVSFTFTKKFVYLRSAFAPCLDDTVRSLYNTYGEEGRLVVHYATTPAWG